jgi:hypothetical protein
MVEMFASAAEPDPRRRDMPVVPENGRDEEEARPRTRIDRLHDRARRIFIVSCYASAGSILFWIMLFVIEIQFPDSLVSRVGQFDTMLSAVITILFGVVAIAIPALTPFVSLFYMIVVLFKGTEFAGREIWLTTFALLTGGLALVLSMDDSACAGITTDTQTCFLYRWGFVLDQFSKGSFADFFDIYEFGLSPLDLGVMSSLTRLYVLNFRLLSAAYLVSLVMAVIGRWRRFKARREDGARASVGDSSGQETA